MPDQDERVLKTKDWKLLAFEAEMKLSYLEWLEKNPESTEEQRRRVRTKIKDQVCKKDRLELSPDEWKQFEFKLVKTYDVIFP